MRRIKLMHTVTSLYGAILYTLGVTRRRRTLERLVRYVSHAKRAPRPERR